MQSKLKCKVAVLTRVVTPLPVPTNDNRAPGRALLPTRLLNDGWWLCEPPAPRATAVLLRRAQLRLICRDGKVASKVAP
jgi:hypothetical protein